MSSFTNSLFFSEFIDYINPCVEFENISVEDSIKFRNKKLFFLLLRANDECYIKSCFHHRHHFHCLDSRSNIFSSLIGTSAAASALTSME